MKHASLGAAAAVVLLANAFALVHAARNRSGETQTGIALTDRELYYRHDSDDSGVALTLRWVDHGSQGYSPFLTPDDLVAATWLNQSKLRELGFDCSVNPADQNASSFYARQSARTGFAAFEYEGDAWKRWLELRRRITDAEPGQRRTFDYDRRGATRLAIIDAASDATSLRTRHPDGGRVLVLPAVFRVSVQGPRRMDAGDQWTPARLTGYIQEVPSIIHVSKPFSDSFRNHSQTSRSQDREDALYTVHLRYGRYLEPWVTAVNFAESIP